MYNHLQVCKMFARSRHLCYMLVNRNYQKKADDFTTIYKFPHIKICSLVNRIKLYQTALTTTGVPLATALHFANVVDSEAIYNTGALGVSGCILLYTMGYFTNKFIGFIYLKNDGSQVKFSYVSFWGRRTDRLVNTSEVIPLSDMPLSITDTLYLKIKTYSKNDTLKISLRYGQITDTEQFNKVFIK